MCRSPCPSSSPLLHETEEGRTLRDYYSATNENDIGRRHCQQQRCRNEDESSNENKKEKNNSRWSAIITGQMIALVLTLGNAASSCLANNYQVSIPTVQTGIVYLLLSFHLVYLHYNQNRNDDDCYEHGQSEPVINDEDMKEEELGVELKHTRNVVTSTTAIEYKFPFTSLKLHAPWHTYALLSVLDVEANYLAMLSFRHTTLSSSMLLTSLSVLSTVALRTCIIRRCRSTIGGQRLLGVILCLIGGCSWLRREFLQQQRHDEGLHHDNDDDGLHVNMVYGDLLAVSAACIYGLNDVLAEYFLKQASSTDVEYVGMLGFFGSLFSLCVQAPLLGEWDRVRTLLREMMHHDDSTKSETILLLFLSFIIMLYYFYTQAMRYLSRYDATSLNLSVQTGPLWAVAIELFSIGGCSPPLMFFVSFAMIVVGVFLYEGGTSDNHRSGCVADKGCDDSRVKSHY